MSFRLTEEYIQAALELERAGYCWQPQAGDWMLDRDDHSVGMLTTPIKNPDAVRRLNSHLPTHAQTDEMLVQLGVTADLGKTVLFRGSDEAVVLDCPRTAYDDDPALCRLRALAAAFRLAR